MVFRLFYRFFKLLEWPSPFFNSPKSLLVPLKLGISDTGAAEAVGTPFIPAKTLAGRDVPKLLWLFDSSGK